MQVKLPKSDRHPLVQLTVTAPGHRHTLMFDDTHSTATIALPEGVSEDDVTVLAEFCDQFSKVDQWAEKITLKHPEQSRQQLVQERWQMARAKSRADETETIREGESPAQEPEVSEIPSATETADSIDD